MLVKNEPIRGKVARILNSRELALNRGTAHGVEVGMVFNILSPNDTDIKDPDTGESLGSVERTKISVKVTAVQEKMSIASTFLKRKVNVGGTGLASSGLGRILEPPRWETHYEELLTNETMLDELDEEESQVRTGDPVVQAILFDDSDESEDSQKD